MFVCLQFSCTFTEINEFIFFEFAYKSCFMPCFRMFRSNQRRTKSRAAITNMPRKFGEDISDADGQTDRQTDTHTRSCLSAPCRGGRSNDRNAITLRSRDRNFWRTVYMRVVTTWHCHGAAKIAEWAANVACIAES